MITLAHAYIVGGLFFAALALLSAHDSANPRRFVNATFWEIGRASCRERG